MHFDIWLKQVTNIQQRTLKEWRGALWYVCLSMSVLIEIVVPCRRWVIYTHLSSRCKRQGAKAKTNIVRLVCCVCIMLVVRVCVRVCVCVCVCVRSPSVNMHIIHFGNLGLLTCFEVLAEVSYRRWYPFVELH